MNKQPQLPPKAPPSPSDGERFTATFMRIGKRLQHLATQLLGNNNEAEDALHEAFIRLWKTPTATHADTAYQEAIITTTVRHISIDAVRRRKAHPAISLDDENEQQHRFKHEQIAEECNEDEEREAKLRCVQRLIDQHLTPTQQFLLRRRDMEDADYATLAVETGLQETAVRMQISRARRTIRELYQQQRNDPHHPSSFTTP